jgi:hypothetical protein
MRFGSECNWNRFTGRDGGTSRNEVDGMLKQRLRVGFAVVVAVAGTSLIGAASAAPVAPVDPDEKGPVVLHPATLFSNFNSGGVVNQPRAATTFTLASGAVITAIQTYHWNGGRGKTPGTVKLVSSSGKSFGPWQTKGIDGQGGVKGAFWQANPQVSIPAGTYTIVDSDPSTWSNNSASGYRGFALVQGGR